MLQNKSLDEKRADLNGAVTAALEGILPLMNAFSVEIANLKTASDDKISLAFRQLAAVSKTVDEARLAKGLLSRRLSPS